MTKTIGLLLGWLLAGSAWAGTGHGDMGAPHGGEELVTFGPGDSFHLHKAIHPEDYETVADVARRPDDLPPPVGDRPPKTVRVDLVAREVVSEIAPGIRFHYWTFNDTVPGPFIRVRVGDTVELTLRNDKSSSHAHNIDLHAVTGPGGGAVLTKVKPGETKGFRFKALNPGLYVYHCAAGNPPTHIANGMYGLILVEPEGGLPPVDHEFYVMQGELYTKGVIGAKGFQPFDGRKMFEERPEYIIFNGRVGALVAHPLKAKVGERIRIFLGNGGVAKISSFHIIGEIFSKVWPEAATEPVLRNVQTTLIPAGGASMVELHLDVPGDYVLVDHALSRIDRGAWGILKVEGPEDPAVYAPLPLLATPEADSEILDVGPVRLKRMH
ncbi:nitrite reductase (NO-forming) [Methylomarinovum tepidoasis]|uniref:Copper-containing nitrite reductase n=1 Tax=Methylomarinovum tepidoasis TaxID=2840183 RepID=A0AAU9C7N6_9GAMM|nr:copper-containing nitrite reductase [Methylomarinovum sp. IN45]BCX87836.1 nitrite reductase (NO-forming) [Methylomarinovum sp. IN45]